MTTPRSLLVAAATALAALAAMTPAVAADATARTPIIDCGDVETLEAGGSFLGAITAQGGTCKNARAVAQQVGKSASCKRTGSCRVRTYRCALAKAGKELTLVRCENTRQTAFVRFEFGA